LARINADGRQSYISIDEHSFAPMQKIDSFMQLHESILSLISLSY